MGDVDSHRDAADEKGGFRRSPLSQTAARTLSPINTAGAYLGWNAIAAVLGHADRPVPSVDIIRQYRSTRLVLDGM